MKKVLSSIIIMGLFVLGGCSNNAARDEFVDSFNQMNDLSQTNAFDFSLTLDEISLDTSSTSDSGDTSTSDSFDFSSMYGSIFSSLEGLGLNGSILMDTENNAIDYKLNFTLMGNDIPFDMLIVDDMTYISGDAFVQLMNLMSTFYDSGVDLSGIADQLTDKYVELDPDEFGEDNSASAMIDMFNQDSGGNVTLLGEYLNTLDGAAFEKDGDKISVNLTEEDLAGFTDFLDENGTDAQKEALGDLDFSDQDFEDLEFLITMDTTTNALEMTCKVVTNDDSGKMTTGVSMSFMPKELSETVTIPSADEIVTEADLDELLAQGATYTISDEDFADILQSIDGAQDYYTQDEIIALFEAEGYVFTDEQKAQIASLYPGV